MKHAPEPMKLSALFAGFAATDIRQEVTVNALTLDSRNCAAGAVYFARKGLTTHGLNFIADVLSANVSAVVVDANDQTLSPELSERITSACELVRVVDLNVVMGDIAARFYKTNAGDCQVVAVTGTDGKTSVCHFIAQALNYREKCAGLLGTAGWGFPEELTASVLTTPDVLEVHRQLHELRQSGARYICMEVSSHALEQGRVDGVEFTAAALTNLAHDHLDFHGSLENYAKAKRKLFIRSELQAVVLNADDRFGCDLLLDREVRSNKKSYGSASESAYRLTKVSSGDCGLCIEAEYNGVSYQFDTGLVGSFNAHNVLACWAVLDVLGFPQSDLVEALSALRPVIGRMEMFFNERGPIVVVDFAHTPQALGMVLAEVRSHCAGKVWCVFGCGGDRDKAKRQKMGQVASKQADYVIVTNDNPRTEDPQAIASDILGGIERVGSVDVMLDRESAIRYSLDKAASNDWVVVAGKGHEDYQIFGQQRIEFSDREIVQKALKEAV